MATKQFFSVIGDELYKIKNSPFSRIGQNKSQHFQQNRSGGLSFDPDRLFDQEKYKQKLKEGNEQYQEFKKREEEVFQRIEYELLKKETNEEFNKKISEFQKHKELSSKKHHNIFQVERTVCQLCNKCVSFEGNFSISQNKFRNNSDLTQFLSCIKCKCPMNSHIAINHKNSFRAAIWKHLQTRELQDWQINAGFFVAAFKIQQKCKINEELPKLLNLFQRVGYRVIEQRVESKHKFEVKQLKCNILRDGVEKGYLESVFRLIDCIGQDEEWDWKNNEGVGEEFQEQYQTISKVYYREQYALQQTDKVLVLLFKENNNAPANFQEQVNLFKSIQEHILPFSFVTISKSQKEAIFMAQFYFPEYFTFNYKLFFCPSQSKDQFRKASQKFKDHLDFNNYIVLLQNLTHLKKTKLENALNFLPYSKVTYLLGEEAVSDIISRVGIKLCLKIGMDCLKLHGEIPEFIEISKPAEQTKVIKELFPELLVSQRCILIIRSFLLSNNCEETIINLLRLNNFIMIKRVKMTLDLTQARYLAVLEHVDEDMIDDYVSFMTSAACEVVLVTKKSAIYEAHTLINGCSEGITNINNRILRDKPLIEIQKGKDIYNYYLQMPGNDKNWQHSDDIFEGANKLFSIESCLLGSQVQNKLRVAVNNKTGEVIKLDEKLPSAEQEIKLTLRQKQSLLSELKTDPFNYFLFSSKSTTTTEQLCSMLFPDCSLFQSIVLIVKPNYLHLLPEIKSYLLQNKFFLIMQKNVQLSKNYAGQLILGLQKIKLERAALRQIQDAYSSQKIGLLCVSKVAGKKQMLSLLYNYDFLPRKNILMQENYANSLELIKQTLIPVWNNEEFFLKMFSKHLGSIEDVLETLAIKQVWNALKQQQRYDILQYFVGSFFGTKITDVALNSNIGQLSYYLTESEIAKMQSWYYSTIANVYAHYVPLLFQYRNYEQRTLVIQTHEGEPFMAAIVNQFLKEQAKLDLKFAQNTYSEKKKRQSITLFVWAKKIVQLVEEVSQLRNNSKPIYIEVQGWGEIIYKNNTYAGTSSSSDQAINAERTFLKKMLHDQAHNPFISAHITKMLQSRLLIERYHSSFRRLLPDLSKQGIEEALRVVETSKISKLQLIDQYVTIDPENERMNKDHHDLYTLNLFRVEPTIKSKYSLLADVILFFQKWEKEALQYREVFGLMLNHIFDSISTYEDLQILEFQLYLKYLELLSQKQINEEALQFYPSFKALKNQASWKEQIGEETAGKKRKFISQKQYYIPNQSHNDEHLESMKQKLKNFDLNTLNENQNPVENQPTLLCNPKDQLHNRWAEQKNIVNLLREEGYDSKAKPQGKGVYVEYETKISENEQVLKNEIQKQVDKFNFNEEDEILKENGLEKQLWYRKTKNENATTGQMKGSKTSPCKVSTAIEKQIQKLKMFKMKQSEFS